MAKRVINDKGFKVIKLNPSECQKIDFGLDTETSYQLICDNCNSLIYVDCYYVAVLNRILCEECFDEWYDSAEHYPEDARWETNKYNHTILRLEAHCITIEEEYYG